MGTTYGAGPYSSPFTGVLWPSVTILRRPAGSPAAAAGPSRSILLKARSPSSARLLFQDSDTFKTS